MQNVTSLGRFRSQAAGSATPNTFFNRKELDRILRVYGHMVAKGEWRDYAIDDYKDEVVFSVFRRTSEVPLYRIVKCPKWAKKQGAYAIHGADGQVLRRGHEIDTLLKFFDRKRFDVVD